MDFSEAAKSENHLRCTLQKPQRAKITSDALCGSRKERKSPQMHFAEAAKSENHLRCTLQK
ncbi:MAG: hypothetical protein M3Y80_00995, partial [Verrucomicrobiota bacterium]|nr:hypothetical protein [Verrucomicrobiota bacterium]